MNIKFIFCTALLLASTTVTAISVVPGTQTFYSAVKDPITDINTSSVLLQEINDTTNDTIFAVRCSNYGRPELWAWMSSKHDMMSASDYDSGVKPAVTLRLGDDAPIVLSNNDLSTVVKSNERTDNQSIGFSGPVVRRIVNGLNSGKRLVVRVNRASGGQALTYTFAASGFSTAWNMVGACGNIGSKTSWPAPAYSTSGVAPKFTRWYFTTCRDTSTGTLRTGIVAGRPHLCDLVIETVPNGAQPSGADFHYELEYREGNQTGKLMLDGVDYWPSGSGALVKYHQNGNQLIFTLPLNVRARPDRVYTSINVTANIQFSNGSSKKVYEPLPVKPAY